MRQRRWLELVKDYDCGINYHPGKANVVVDALSRRTSSSCSYLKIISPHILRDLQRLRVDLVLSNDVSQLNAMTVHSNLLERIRLSQAADHQLIKVRDQINSEKCKDFQISGGDLLRFKGRICIPNDIQLKKEILSEAHSTPYQIHPGSTKMYQDLKSIYWWSGLKTDVARFVEQCLTCQQVKAEHQRPAGTLVPLAIPEWKWENVTMDFVSGFPNSGNSYNSIWVVVDRLTKTAHFLPVRTTFTMEQYAELYIKEIVRLHGVPISLVSDRDPRFTSAFWKSLQRALGTQLCFSTAFHPQSDGQSERTIQILEDMLRACALDYPGSWSKFLPLAEFAYNNSHQASIGMAPYEALYGRKCRSPLHWDEVGERRLLAPDLLQKTTEVVEKIKQRMHTAQNRQKSYADLKRRHMEFDIGDKVFLKVTPLKGVIRFGKRGKLNPRYIGPFEILDRVGLVAYRLALPPSLSKVHNVFHISMLRKYVANPSHVLSKAPTELTPNMSYEEYPVQILDHSIKQLRGKDVLLVKVLWRNHAVEEATWERESDIRASYPELFS